MVLAIGVIAASPRRPCREHFPLLGSAVIVILAYAVVLHEQLGTRAWIASAHQLWRQAAETLGILITLPYRLPATQPFFGSGSIEKNEISILDLPISRLGQLASYWEHG